MDTVDFEERLDAAAEYLRSRDFGRPCVAIVAGSGLGVLADSLLGSRRIAYEEIPYMPRPTVSGHAGSLVIGRWSEGGGSVALLGGRKHFYEGGEQEGLVMGTCLMARLGVRRLLLTNAAGGLHPDFRTGDLMLVRDTLNRILHRSPLPVVGARGQGGAPGEHCDPVLADILRRKAGELGIALREGVYAGMQGPTYETRSEIRMLRRQGADAVGMSTVPELLAAAQSGLPAAAVSLITNECSEIPRQPLNHEEVIEAGAAARGKLISLLGAVAGALSGEESREDLSC